MPLYVYKCNECGERQEAYKTISERDDSPVCGTCGSTMQRRITTPSLSFVGIGFSRGYVPSGKE